MKFASKQQTNHQKDDIISPDITLRQFVDTSKCDRDRDAGKRRSDKMIWAKEETMSRAEIEAVQLARLKEAVTRNYERVPAYRA